MNSILTQRLAYVSILVVASVSLLNADLDLRMSRLQIESSDLTEFAPPSTTAMRIAFLNHTTMAADVLWIGQVVAYGEARRIRHRPELMVENARKLAEMDPYFRDLYEWFPGAYLSSYGIAGEKRIQQTNEILELGMEAFPRDPSLPFSAAMNYVGHSINATPERRIRELKKGLAYLERAARIPGAPATIPLNARWFHKRLDQFRELGGKKPVQSRQDEIAFNLEILRETSSPEMAESIRQNLKLMGVPDEVLADAGRDVAALQRAHTNDRFHYVPVELWLQIRK